MSTAPVRVGEWFAIPPEELQWRFDTSGGPGGQHANRSATRVELSWDAAASTALGDEVRSRLLARLGPRAAGGIVTVSAADTRSQWRNRAIARRRLEDMLRDALREAVVRLPTATTAGARRRRAESKRRRSALKRLRRPPVEEE